jgi:hypothetical protein
VPRKCTAYLRHLNLPNQRLEKVGHVDREKHETAENPRHFHNSAYVITVLSPVFPVKRICRLRLIFVSVSPSIRQSDRFIGQETEEFPNIVREKLNRIAEGLLGGSGTMWLTDCRVC